MKKLAMALAAATMALTGCVGTADAYQYRHGYYSQNRGYYPHNQRYKYDRYDRRYDRRYDNRRTWRGRDGRYYCRRSDGTTGAVVGAVAGGLFGRTIDTRGDRTLGTVLGGVAGGLAGREIDRSNCR